MARIARGDEFVDSALEVIANAVTVEQVCQASAVVLPLRFGMTLEQTAQIAGVSVGWASRLRNRFILGKPVGDGCVHARGGRRHQNFTFEQEAALLKSFLHQASGLCKKRLAGVHASLQVVQTWGDVPFIVEG